MFTFRAIMYFSFIKQFKPNLILLLAVLFLGACSKKPVYHSPKREFRGIWLTSLYNLDFPSSNTLTEAQQKKELIKILDFHKAMGVNAIIFQVRAMADAMYVSKTEPWASCLTGKSDSIPKNFYDPLAFIIQEAHNRNMELHAWFNPYRVLTNIEKNKVSKRHIINKKPQWVLTYDKVKFLNPALPEVRNYIKDVVVEVVKNYDIDAVHFDDYFYPYPKKNIEIPDKESFEKYGKAFNNIADWRRNNTALLIELIAKNIQKTKPRVKFGISPFGIWRNIKEDGMKGSKTMSRSTSYDFLYADVLQWVNKGWIDYVSPQVYWSIGYKYASYDILVPWWRFFVQNCHLYIGQAIYKIKNNGDKRWNALNQIPSQLRFNRKQKTQGQIFFRSKFLTHKNQFLVDSLRSDFYKYPAIPPSMPWKDNIPPHKPKNLNVYKKNKEIILTWETPKIAIDGDVADYYAIYRFPKGVKVDIENSKYLISKINSTTFTDAKPLKKATYVITAFDKLHNESKAVTKRFSDKAFR